MSAAWNGKQSAVGLLLTAGFNPNALGRLNSTLFQAAVTTNLDPTILSYIKHINKISLESAIAYNCLYITRAILARRIQIAPLLCIGIPAGVEFFKLGLADGAYINNVIENIVGADQLKRGTPLSLAVPAGNMDVMMYLLSIGAKANTSLKRHPPIMDNAAWGHGNDENAVAARHRADESEELPRRIYC